MAKVVGFDAELSALSAVLGALQPLEEVTRLFVLRTAMDRLNVNLTEIGTRTQGSSPTGFASTGTPSNAQVGSRSLSGVGAKDFMRGKHPTTDVQRMACLAYFLTHSRDTKHFKTADLTKLNTDAAGSSFSNPAVAVMHATSSYSYLAPAGGGKKQITALGEDIVEALPDQDRVKQVIAAANTRKKGSAKKRKKKVAKS